MSGRNGVSRFTVDDDEDWSDAAVLLRSPWSCLRRRHQRRALRLAFLIGQAAAREDKGLKGGDLRLYRKLILREGLDSIDRAFWKAASSTSDVRVIALHFGVLDERARAS